MRQCRRTLTVVGLPVQKELLVRSLLTVVNTRTRDRWYFSDSIDSDVALCDPSSALTLLAQKHAQRTGFPQCVSVVREGVMPLPETPVLSAPIYASNFIALLDALSSTLSARTTSVDAATSAPLRITFSEDKFRVGVALHDLVGRASRDVQRIDANGVIFHVIPAARALLLRQPLDEDALPHLFRARDVSITPLTEGQTQDLFGDGAKPQSIDWLLWRAGLDGPHDRLLPTLPADATFALRRWPDFGRLKHQPFHLRMAALLTRAAHSIDQLSAAVAQSGDECRAFVNACALSDLVEVHQKDSAQEPSSKYFHQTVAPSTNRYAGIFRSIRHVLGFTQS